MAVAKQAEAGAPVTPLVVAGTVAAVAAAVWFQYPAALIALIGALVASFTSQPPQFTGPKDPATGEFTVGNPGERKKLARHRAWMQFRRSLLTPGMPWPLQFAHLAAFGAAFIMFTTPYEGAWAPLNMVGAGEAVVALPWLNAAAAYLLVIQVALAMRSKDPDSPPMPATEVVALFGKFGKDPKVTVTTFTTIVIAGGIAAVWWWWLEAARWFYITPSWLSAFGVLLVAAAAIGHHTARGPVRLAWEQTAEARQTWEARWAAMAKVKEKPTLVSHERLGEQGECWIDVFEAPMSEGSAKWIPAPDGVQPTLPPNTLCAFVSAPDVDGEGQPILVSKSAIRFKALTWNLDYTPNLTDPSIDRELLAAWLELRVRETAIRNYGAMFDFIPTGPPAALHVEQETFEAGETAAWLVEYDVPGTGVDLAGSLQELAPIVGRELECEAIALGGSLYLGAVTAETTTLQDRSIVDTLEAEAERAMWDKRWFDLAAIQAPTYFPELSKSVKLGGGAEIHSRLFGAPAGFSAATYFQKVNMEGIRSALPGSQWVSLSYYVDPRTKERYPGYLHLFWSNEPIPMNPAAIAPATPRGGDREAPTWAITGAITHAFLAAKLSRPEVIRAVPLTSKQSRSHIWDLTLALYDGVTLQKVKRAQEQIRLALGGCEWIRITEAPEGCRIVVGANPQSRRAVTFANDTAEMITTRLDWEQAFTESRVENMNGRVPVLKSMESLPKNDLVKNMTFVLPPGLSVATLKDKRDKLSSATGNAFLDIRQGAAANEAQIMAAELDPMPTLAQFDWAEVENSDAVPFATSIYGEPVVFNPIDTPHLLFMGDSGTGKSAALQAVLTPAAIRGWDLVLLDSVKGAADFKFLFPYASMVATETKTVAAALKRVYAEVVRRKELNAKHGTARVSNIVGDDRPRHMIVMIDELLSAVTQDPVPTKLTGDESEDELRDIEMKRSENLAKREIGTILGRIAREARSAGVTIVAATQSLTKEETDKTPGVFDVKKQAARVLLGKSNWGQKAGAFKNPDAAPDLGDVVPKGRGIFESAEGAPIVFQSWFDYYPDQGGDPNAAHLASMAQHIAAARSPEAVQITDDDLRPKDVAIQVYGEIIGGEPADEEVVDLGELDLSELDFSEFEATEGEEASASSGVEVKRELPEPYSGTSASGPQVWVLPFGTIVGVGSESIDCEYGTDRFDQPYFETIAALGEVTLLVDDEVMADSLGLPAIPVPINADHQEVVAAVLPHWSGEPCTVVVHDPNMEDELGVSLADYFQAAGMCVQVIGPAQAAVHQQAEQSSHQIEVASELQAPEAHAPTPHHGPSLFDVEPQQPAIAASQVLDLFD